MILMFKSKLESKVDMLINKLRTPGEKNMIKNIQNYPYIKDMSFSKREVRYTNHARERGNQKDIRLLKSLTVNKGSVVEYENISNKYVVRIPNLEDTEYDTVMVVVDMQSFWLCVTIYKNHRLDNHRTLRLAA